jgi:hypothetical protein
MNILRTGGRSDRDGVINEPGSARFPESLLPPKDLHRPRGSNPSKVINDCQSLIKRWAQGSDTPFDNMKACTIHMIMIVVWLTVGCRTMDREASWEYTRTNDFSRLQELAKEGWALDSWHALGSNDGGTMYIMKRKAH